MPVALDFCSLIPYSILLATIPFTNTLCTALRANVYIRPDQDQHQHQHQHHKWCLSFAKHAFLQLWLLTLWVAITYVQIRWYWFITTLGIMILEVHGLLWIELLASRTRELSLGTLGIGSLFTLVMLVGIALEDFEPAFLWIAWIARVANENFLGWFNWDDEDDWDDLSDEDDSSDEESSSVEDYSSDEDDLDDSDDCDDEAGWNGDDER